MIFFLINIILCKKKLGDDFAHVEAGIKKIHDKTPFATLYDLFDIYQNASLQQIQKRYKHLLRQKKTIEGLSLEESENIYTEAYNILTKNKYSYDYLLKYQVFPTEGYKWYYWLLVLFVSLFLIDILAMLIRYSRFKKLNPKAKKKIERKGKSIRGIQFSELYISKVFIWLKNKIVG
ncbi:hypothetical protein GVAV_003324 [Gurleya vavrai]